MSTRRSRSAVVIAASLTMVLTFSGTAEAAKVIRNNGNTFTPSAVRVQKGTKVVWRMVSGVHTVTSTSPNWSKNVVLSAGQRTARTFKRTGVFRFRCRFHSSFVNGVCSGMCGRVRVVA